MSSTGNDRWCATRAMTICTLLLAASGCSEHPEADRYSGVSVYDGRLVFANVGAFSEMIDHLNEFSDGPNFDQLMNAFPAFRPLKDPDRNASWSPAIRAILNDEHLYQIADELFVMDSDLEYVIPASNSWIVSELQRGASAEQFAAAGMLRIYGSARFANDKMDNIVEGDISSLLNAKYQYPFSTPAHTYKFIDEAYVDVYSAYVNACFRAKFEYYKGGRDGWKPAGERVYKQIGRVDPADGTPQFGGAYITDGGGLRYEIAGKRQDDSSNLTVCRSFVPGIGPQLCVTGLKLHADFYSRAPANLNKEYRVEAGWNTEFVDLTLCNLSAP